MRLFKPTYKTPDGQVKESPRWWLDFRWNRRRGKLPGFTSKSQSEAMGRRLVDLMAALASGETPDVSLVRWAQALSPSMQTRLVKAGLMDGRFAAFGKPLAEHLEDWTKVLAAKGNTSGHVDRYRADVNRILIIAKAVYLADLTPSRVQRAIGAMKEGTAKVPGLSLQTCNHAASRRQEFHAVDGGGSPGE